jgi:phosphoribosylanthranilate isomerase
MKIKVCGMKYQQNIAEVLAAKPDYIGFIFYPKSKRFAGDVDSSDIVDIKNAVKVGVFVNESLENIRSKCAKYHIDHVQLHGEESPELCKELKKGGMTVIKVFSVGPGFDFEETKAYDQVADYFLFDTKSENYGGTGKKFDWSIFEKYSNNKEIFLSGGIGLNDAEEIKNIKGLKVHAIDINSCFEKEPAVKDASMVKAFIDKIRS